LQRGFNGSSEFSGETEPMRPRGMQERLVTGLASCS
jgi:hypothetical protein